MRVLTDWTHLYGQGPEDQWYYARSVISSLSTWMSADGCRMKDLEKNLLEKRIEDVINLASMEIVRTFAVETIDYPHPLGLQYIQLHASTWILRRDWFLAVSARPYDSPWISCAQSMS